MAGTSPPDERELTQMLAICKIIAGTLVFGVVSFAAVAIALRIGEVPEPDAFISFLAAGFAAAAVIVRQVVLGVMSGRAVPDSTASGSAANSSFGLYQSRLIVGLALLEGAAFFNLIAYLLEGHWWSFLVVAALLAWMLASFPTRSRLSAMAGGS